MTATTTLTKMPETDNPMDAWPSFLAREGSDTILLFASTAHTSANVLGL